MYKRLFYVSIMYIFIRLKKIFHILFAVYFIVLIGMPCADREDCNEFKQTELSQTSHQQEHSDEVCTPFCMCACCAAHFLSSGIDTDFELSAGIITTYTSHHSPGIRGAVIAVWQPPKLG